MHLGFPDSSGGKESTCIAGDLGCTMRQVGVGAYPAPSQLEPGQEPTQGHGPGPPVLSPSPLCWVVVPSKTRWSLCPTRALVDPVTPALPFHSC